MCLVLSSFVVAGEPILEGKEGSWWLLPFTYWQKWAQGETRLVGYMMHRCPNASVFALFLELKVFFEQWLYHQIIYPLIQCLLVINLLFYVVEKGIVHATEICMLRHLVQRFVSCSCAEILSLGNMVFLISVLAVCCQQPPAHTLTQTILLCSLINHPSPACLWFSQS